MSGHSSLAACWLAMKDRPSERVAVRIRRSTGWYDITWAQYSRDIELASAGLISLGLDPRGRVALMSNTRYEWGCADFAIMVAGATTVPIYPNTTAEDVSEMLRQSGSEIIILESRTTLKVWRKIREHCPQVKRVLCFETDDPTDPELLTWDALLALGRKYLQEHPQSVRTRAERVLPEDIATLLYTSGTTGRSKGVLLGHEQAISEVSEAFTYVGAEENDESLCFLPLSHILGRVELWGHAWVGFTLSYAESIEKVRSNLTEVRPTIMVAVPRIFEKVHSAIISQMDSQPIRRQAFAWALDIGRRVLTLRQTKQVIPIYLLAQYELARRLVFDKVKEAFGGRLRFAISGGAPIQKEISEFFASCGVLILEGYGLTETTAAITVNTPHDYRFGSVGKPFGDTQIRIAPDGEILVKSKKVMRGYDKDPEATAASIKDGWFHTGDIGEILPSGDLRITDRKKDLIKTAGGKYVAPQKIEGLLQLHPFVGHSVIHGDNRKFIVTLIAPDRLALEADARLRGVTFQHWTDLIDDPVVQKAFRTAVMDANSHLASWESVKKYAILRQELTVEGGELTPSLKVRRKALEKKFSALLDSLYD